MRKESGHENKTLALAFPDHVRHYIQTTLLAESLRSFQDRKIEGDSVRRVHSDRIAFRSDRRSFLDKPAT